MTTAISFNLLHMSRQCSLLQELTTTNGTRMWNTTVQLSVIDQLELSGKCGSTVCTRKRVDGAVETRVHVQVFLLSETFAAILFEKETLIKRPKQHFSGDFLTLTSHM